MSQGYYSDGPLSVDAISATTDTGTVALGTRIWADGREYTYVYNAGNSQISKGNICVVSGTSGYSVTVSSVVDPYSKPFGVVRNATLTTGAYGWVVREGFVDLYSSGDTAVVAGSPVIPAADGEVTQATGGTGTTGAMAVFGTAMQATTTAGTFGAYVRCQ